MHLILLMHVCVQKKLKSECVNHRGKTCQQHLENMVLKTYFLSIPTALVFSVFTWIHSFLHSSL